MATHALDENNNLQNRDDATLTDGQRPKHFGHAIESFLMETWATIITIFLGLLVLAALLVPFLSYFGLDSIAKPMFYTLHYVCAQIPSHSFFILGHQLGMCARNLSIYAAMFVGSLVFTLSKKRFPGIPWWLWVLCCLPMAWDGFTQMFGLRESTWELRVLTGVLFGLASVWFILPMMHKTLIETANVPTVPVRRPRPHARRVGHIASINGTKR